MQLQNNESSENLNDFKSQQSSLAVLSSSQTLGNLIQGITFNKKTKLIKKKAYSQTSSISSNQSVKSKEKSKLWTEEQDEKFLLLIKKHGPDFQTLVPFFQKKSKNQLKNKYKEYLNNEKKKSKQKPLKLQAVTVGSLFQQVDQKEEYL